MTSLPVSLDDSSDPLPPARGPAGLPGNHGDASEDIYRAVFDNLLNGFVVYDVVADERGPVDYRFVEVNRAFEAQLGLRAAEVVGKPLSEVVPEVDRLPLLAAYRKVVLGGKPERFNLHLPSAARHFSLIVFPLPGGRLAVTFHDNTERARAREVLQRYRLLFESARDVILFVRYADGRILEANAAAVQAYGYDLEELLGMTVGELRVPEERAQLPAQMRRALDEGLLFETVHRRKDGTTFPVEVSSRGDEIGGEQVLLSIVRDVGERKRLQQERELFFEVAAHEMRTPLTALKGFTQLLRRAGHDAAEERKFEMLGSQVERLSRLVQAMISASQLQSGTWAPALDRVELGDLARAAAAKAERAHPELAVRVECPGQLFAQADRERIGEVLFHLLDNAGKYASCRPIDVKLRAEGGEAVVSVIDRGPGISAEQKARLFDACFQVRPMVSPTSGMGLGLFICREIVRSHRGRIWVESAVGEGAEFSFTVPLAQPN